METGFSEGRKQRLVSRKELAFLKGELDYWDRSGLLEARQRQTIEGLYALSAGRFSQVIVALGALLIGLGFLSYIAANWMELSRTLKVLLVLGVYTGTNLVSWRLEPAYPKTSRALLLLASIAYGGGIFLIAQIFHQGGHYTDALFWWLAGLLPVALLFADRLQLLLMQAVYLFYLHGLYGIGSYLGGYGDLNVVTFADFLLGFIQPSKALLLFAVLWALWFRIDKRWGVGFKMNVFIGLNFLGLHCIRYFQDVVVLIVFFAVLGVVFCFCGTGYWKEDLTGWGVVLLGLSGLILTLPDVWGWSRILQLDMLPYLSPSVLAIGWGIATCAFLLWFSRKGSILAVSFFCLLILRFYLDKFYDFMPKALFFTGGGLVLVGLGFLMEHTRKIGKNKKTAPLKEEAKP